MSNKDKYVGRIVKIKNNDYENNDFISLSREDVPDIELGTGEEVITKIIEHKNGEGEKNHYIAKVLDEEYRNEEFIIAEIYIKENWGFSRYLKVLTELESKVLDALNEY